VATGVCTFLALSPPAMPGLGIAATASLLAVVLGRVLPVERWIVVTR